MARSHSEIGLLSHSKYRVIINKMGSKGDKALLTENRLKLWSKVWSKCSRSVVKGVVKAWSRCGQSVVKVRSKCGQRCGQSAVKGVVKGVVNLREKSVVKSIEGEEDFILPALRTKPITEKERSHYYNKKEEYVDLRKGKKALL